MQGEGVIAILPTILSNIHYRLKSNHVTGQREQGLNISYSCLVFCPLESIIQDQIAEATSLGIVAMKMDDDFKNDSSKHAHLLFATAEYVMYNRSLPAC